MASFPAGAVIAIKIRKIIQAFENAGATGPGSAVSAEKLGISNSLLFQRLVSNKVLVETVEKNYYLNLANLQRYQEKRRKRASIMLLVILALVLSGLILSYLK